MCAISCTLYSEWFREMVKYGGLRISSYSVHLFYTSAELVMNISVPHKQNVLKAGRGQIRIRNTGFTITTNDCPPKCQCTWQILHIRKFGGSETFRFETGEATILRSMNDYSAYKQSLFILYYRLACIYTIPCTCTCVSLWCVCKLCWNSHCSEQMLCGFVVQCPV